MPENALSIFQCGFRKKCSTQHALIAVTEKARKILDKGGTFDALLTDLSKSFDCMTHDLLIAKLHSDWKETNLRHTNSDKHHTLLMHFFY